MPENKKNGPVKEGKTAPEEKPAEKPSKADKKEKTVYKPRAKPEITPDEKLALDQRRDKTCNRPEFHRQEWFRYQRIGDQWRKPRGLHSKMRRHIGYRPNIVSIGYRGPKLARGRHPSGFEEVMVFNPKDLETLNPKKQAIRIGHSVGYLKRMHIALKADEMNLRILNFNRATFEELVSEAKKRGLGKNPKEGDK